MEINKIYNESNLETMARMPDNYIDLVVTSPPYDNLREYKGYSFPFEEIAKELFRVTKIGGVVVWVVSDSTKNGSESLNSFKQAIYFNSIGFRLHDTMIYAKNNPIPMNHNRYEQVFEFAFIFSKGKPKTFNPIKIPIENINATHCGGFRNKNKSEMPEQKRHSKSTGNTEKIKGNIWFYNVGSNQTSKDKIAFEHPAIFPEQLANDHILSWSNENDIVYDPFMGSGTSAKMAIKNNRNWIGSEISEEYCRIIEQRIQLAEPLLSF